MDRFISEIFDHFEEPFGGGDDYFVGDGHPQEAKLNNKLLESFEIQFMDLSFMHQLDVDISEHAVDFRLSDKPKKPVIFQHFSQLNSGEEFLPSDVVLDSLCGVVGVHCCGVEEEEMSQHSVIFFQHYLDGFDVS